MNDFTKKYHEEYTDGILLSYNLIKEYNPKFIYSIRDLKNVALSFEVLTGNKKPNKETLLKVCISEFAGTIADPILRKKYISDLSYQLKIPKSDEKTAGLIKFESGGETYFIPKDKQYLLDAIDIDLAIREQHSKPLDEKFPAKHYKKAGFLFEGEPGVGKSTLFRLALESKGFNEIKLKPGESLLTAKPLKPGLCFIEINAGDPSALTILEQAYKKEYIVILNEPNIHPELERKAIELLDKSKNKPLFRIYASQNPSTHEDRIDTPALNNRLNFNYMDAYSRESLIEIAQEKGVEFPEIFVDEFMKSNATMRKFFKDANDLEKAALWTFKYYASQKNKQFDSYRLFAEKKLHPSLDLKVAYDSPQSAVRSAQLIKPEVPALAKKRKTKHAGPEVSGIKHVLSKWKPEPSMMDEDISALAKLVNVIFDMQLQYRDEKILSVSTAKSEMMRKIEEQTLDYINNQSTINQLCLGVLGVIKPYQDKTEPGTLVNIMKMTSNEVKLIGMQNLISKYISHDPFITKKTDFKSKIEIALNGFLKKYFTSITERDFMKLAQSIKCVLALRELCKNPSQDELLEITRVENNAIEIIASGELLNEKNMFDLLINPAFYVGITHGSEALRDAKSKIVDYVYDIISPKVAKEIFADNKYDDRLFAPPQKTLDHKFEPLNELSKELSSQIFQLEQLIKPLAAKNLLIDIQLHELLTINKLKNTPDALQRRVAILRGLTEVLPVQLKQQIKITCDYVTDALKAVAINKPFPLA